MKSQSGLHTWFSDELGQFALAIVELFPPQCRYRFQAPDHHARGANLPLLAGRELVFCFTIQCFVGAGD